MVQIFKVVLIRGVKSLLSEENLGFGWFLFFEDNKCLDFPFGMKSKKHLKKIKGNESNS